jgi:radical SAM protein with 4Fe4S-binding SPASM domain
MDRLMREMSAKALALGIPLSVQLDLTYRCNERCVHCYLVHDDRGEMATGEIVSLLDQLAEAGTFFLVLSGGEIFLREDLFAIIAHARGLKFSVKLKTNAVMMDEAAAARVASLGVESVQVSVYSHRADVHDAITRLPGSFGRTMEGARLLKASGVRVGFTNVLMTHNATDYTGVQALARELGADYHVDPTITPMMDGDRAVLGLNIGPTALAAVLHDPAVAERNGEFCEPPDGAQEERDALETLPCSAGHTLCYISPFGDVFPCVQFPLSSGNVRTARFLDIWRNSPQLRDVRSITMTDLRGCSTCVHERQCSRCPGLAYMEGNMRGPSTQDCEKSFARTGVMPLPLLDKEGKTPPAAWLATGHTAA